ncbi:hypothetical protein ACN9ML_24225 [Dyadobacter endophyticus]|uniref:hypothetical protein n=1 Tax=Dyadobacter endophyticus TaxID=1749036 RepID=UPI003CFA808A
MSDFIVATIGRDRFSLHARKDNPHVIVISVPDVGVQVEIEESRFKISADTQVVATEDWLDFTKRVNELLLTEAYSRLIDDFVAINNASNHFKSLGPFETTYPPELKGKKIPEEDLHYTCLPVFAHRLATCCHAARTLASNTYRDAVGNELAIGILLRTAVLDSILIMGWLAHPEIASALAVDSLHRISKIKGKGESVDKLRKKWSEFSTYFNAHNLSPKDTRISVDGILDRLPNSPNLNEYRYVYEYYSKYDHFSLLPYIIKKPQFGYLAIMVMSTHLIKHAFCAMVCIYLPDHKDAFELHLGIKSQVDEDGFITFSS